MYIIVYQEFDEMKTISFANLDQVEGFVSRYRLLPEDYGLIKGEWLKGVGQKRSLSDIRKKEGD